MMARRSFHVIDIAEILMHWYAGRTGREIADSLGVSRNTVAKYVTPALAEGIRPGGPPVAEAEWAEHIHRWFPDLQDGRLRRVSWPAIAEHRDYIVDQLKRGVTMATIHQRLRDEQGLACSSASLRRWVGANLPEEVRRSQVTVLRLEPPRPGEEAQVDYGRLGVWIDPQSGRRHHIWAFAVVLCCSRHLFVKPVITMDQHAWCQAHVEAFEFFGGAPARIVPDNLKTGVDRPDLYDPKINKSYAELGVHYRVLIDPARSGKPKDKPQIERPMPYIRDSFWRGREDSFMSIAGMEADALRWCVEVAGQRACRPLDGAAPLTVFQSVEQPKLRPMPHQPFELARWFRAKVGPDIHCSVDKVLYSVPWKYIGKHLAARVTVNLVQFFYDGVLVKTHVRKPRGKQTDLTDYPPEKIAFHMRSPAWCRKKATEIGPGCVAVIDELLADHALYHLRSAQGVLAMADKHNPERLEAACLKALAAGDPSYRTIKGILAADLEHLRDGRPAGDDGAGAFLRGPQELFADMSAYDNVVPLHDARTFEAS